MNNDFYTIKANELNNSGKKNVIKTIDDNQITENGNNSETSPVSNIVVNLSENDKITTSDTNEVIAVPSKESPPLERTSVDTPAVQPE